MTWFTQPHDSIFLTLDADLLFNSFQISSFILANSIFSSTRFSISIQSLSQISSFLFPHIHNLSLSRDTKLWMFQPQAKTEEASAVAVASKTDCDEVDGEVVPSVEPPTLAAPLSDSKLRPSPERIGSSNSEGIVSPY